MRHKSYQLLLLLRLLLFQHLLLLELQMLLGMLLLIQKGSSAGLYARKRRSLLHRGMADIRNSTAHIGHCSVLSIRHCLRCLPRFGARLHLASSTGSSVRPLQLVEMRHPTSIPGRMTSGAKEQG